MENETENPRILGLYSCTIGMITNGRGIVFDLLISASRRTYSRWNLVEIVFAV